MLQSSVLMANRLVLRPEIGYITELRVGPAVTYRCIRRDSTHEPSNNLTGRDLRLGIGKIAPAARSLPRFVDT